MNDKTGTTVDEGIGNGTGKSKNREDCFWIRKGIASKGQCGDSCGKCRWDALSIAQSPRPNKLNFPKDLWSPSSAWSCLTEDPVCPYRGPCWNQWRTTPRSFTSVLQLLQVGSLDAGSNQSFVQQVGFRVGLVPQLVQYSCGPRGRHLSAGPEAVGADSPRKLFFTMAAAAFADATHHLDVHGFVAKALEGALDLSGPKPCARAEAGAEEAIFAILMLELFDVGSAVAEGVMEELHRMASEVPAGYPELARLSLVAQVLCTRHSAGRVTLPEAVVDFCCDVTNLAPALLGKSFEGRIVTESVIGYASVVAQSLGMVGSLAAKGTARLLKSRLDEGFGGDKMAPSDVFAILAGMAALGHPLAWDDARGVSAWNNKMLQSFQEMPEGYLKNAEQLLAVAGVDNLRRKGQELVAPSRKVLEETLTRIARQELYGLDVDFTVYYHPGHTWLRPLDAGWFTVGLDDFALRLAGKVDKVVLPEDGTMVKQGEAACWLEKGGSRVAIPSPVTGWVVFSNPALAESLGTGQMNDPYENAWLFAVEPERIEQEAPQMLKGTRAVGHMRADVKSLLHETSGVAVGLDGASLAQDLLAGASPAQWANTMKRFLDR